MYIVRSFSRLLFVVTLGAFAAFLFLHRSQVDSRGPVIDIEDPLIEVSVKDGDDRFLEGVTASDSKVVNLRFLAHFLYKIYNIIRKLYQLTDS